MTKLHDALLLGYTEAGTPVYKVSGGSPLGDGDEQGGAGAPPAADEVVDGDDDTTRDAGGDDGDNDSEDDQDDDDKLGEAGKKALQAERDRAKRLQTKLSAARDALKGWEGLGKEFGLTPEQARARLQGKVKDAEGKEVDVAELRRTIESEVRAGFQQKLVGAQVKAQAAETFHNAEDALLHVKLSELDVDEDGNVDPDDVKDALAAVLASRPYLGKTTTAPQPKRRPSGGSGQGSGKGSGGEKPTGSVAAGMQLWRTTGKSKINS